MCTTTCKKKCSTLCSLNRLSNRCLSQCNRGIAKLLALYWL